MVSHLIHWDPTLSQQCGIESRFPQGCKKKKGGSMSVQVLRTWVRGHVHVSPGGQEGATHSVSISLGVQSADLLATLQVVPNERVIRTPSDSLRSIRRDIQTEDLQCVGMLVSVM